MSRPTQGTDPVYREEVTIASNAAVSSSVNISKIGPRGIAVKVPSVWTGANLGLQYSDDDSTWIPLRNEEGNVVKITNIKTAEVSGYVFPAAAWAIGVHVYMRVVSLDTTAADTAWTTKNQGAARTLEVTFLS